MKLQQVSGTLIQVDDKPKEYLESDDHRYWYLNTSVDSGGCLPHGVVVALDRIGKKDFYPRNTLVKDRQHGIFASEQGDKHRAGITDCTSGSCFYRDVDPNYLKWDAVGYQDIAVQLGISRRTAIEYAKEGMPVHIVNHNAVAWVAACRQWMIENGKL